MKQYTYNKQANKLIEQASMQEPKEPDAENYYDGADHFNEGRFNSDRYHYEGNMEIYINHINALRQIDCSPQCREVWKDGQVVKEGEVNETYHIKREYTDRLSEWDEVPYEVYCNTPETHRMILAYPIHQEQESEDEMCVLNDMAKLFNRPKFSLYEYGHFKQHFSITRKIK